MILLAAVLATLATTGLPPVGDVVVATGIPGEAAYAPAFERQAAAWLHAARAGGLAFHRIPPDAGSRAALEKTLAALPAVGGDLWIVLAGHGSFDGRTPRFSLAGPDLTAADLARWLDRFERRVIVLTLFSAGGAFTPEVAGPNRVVLSATRSGDQKNAVRFGEHLADALAAPESDLDGDERVTLAELAVRADAETRRWYENEQRMVPEHASLDDDGDGVAASVAELLDSERPARDGAGAAAVTLGVAPPPLVFSPALDRRRTALEERIAALRADRAKLGEDRYLARLEPILRELAALYAEARASAPR